MNLKELMYPYIDGNSLVAPYVVPPNTIRGSDNGPMYSAEYVIMLLRNSYVIQDTLPFQQAILNCIGSDGQLHRAPLDFTPDEVDDHYAVIAMHVELDTHPKFKLPIRLWRQPQLLYAYLLAIGVPSFLLSPLNVWTALVIATSCIGASLTDTDSRRLSWHLVQSTKKRSLLCWLASKIWYARLHRDYPNGMLDVAQIYYQANHPFQTFWKE